MSRDFLYKDPQKSINIGTILAQDPLYTKKPVFNDSKADIRALEKELDSERRINRLNGQIIDCYQNEILPSWRDRIEKAEAAK